MPKSREQLVADNERLRANFEKEFGEGNRGGAVDDLIQMVLTDRLWTKQREFVAGILGSYSSAELVMASEIDREIQAGKIIPRPDPAAHLNEEPWVPKKALGKKVVTRKAKTKSKGK